MLDSSKARPLLFTLARPAMDSARRDFLRTSATTTAALTLGPMVGGAAAAAEPAHATVAAADDPKATERRLLRAHPIPLERIRLTGGPLKHAQELDAAYLLSLDPDRMLHYYRVRAGLPSKVQGYTGWDGDGRNLTGHIAGHHLSAVSLMYAATGDARFKQRADYIVREFDEVQTKNGNGYLGALEGLPDAFARLSRGEIKSGGFDLNGLWSPWYTLHKTYAGLREPTATREMPARCSWRSSMRPGPRRSSRRSATRRCSRCSSPSSAG